MSSASAIVESRWAITNVVRPSIASRSASLIACSVDASTEQAIKEALREAMRGRTTFVIAHRLSTIALADDIVVLEDGELVARGTHDELLQESELYAEIAEKGLPDQVFLNRDPIEKVAGL